MQVCTRDDPSLNNARDHPSKTRKRKNMNNKFWLIVLFAAGVTLRFYLLHFRGYEFDINTFLKWGNQINAGGFWSLYTPHYFPTMADYPPFIPIVTAWWLHLNPIIVQFNQIEFFKVLPTLAEIVLVLISSFIVLKSSAPYKYILAGVILVSPSLALVTSGWGQVDSIMCLLILLGFLFSGSSKTLATILIFLSLLAKPQAIIAVAIYYLYLFFKNKKDFLIQGLFFVAMTALIWLVFRTAGHSEFLDAYTKSVGRYDNLSLNAFNLWWFIYGKDTWEIHVAAKTIISFSSVGLTLWLVSEVPAIYYLARSKKIEQVLFVLGYSYLTFFTFMTQMHERYLFPAVAFLAVAAIIDKRIYQVYLVISATFLLNIFAVLQSVYPQFSFLRENLLNADWTKLVALANIMVCLYLLFVFFRSVKSER